MDRADKRSVACLLLTCLLLSAKVKYPNGNCRPNWAAPLPGNDLGGHNCAAHLPNLKSPVFSIILQTTRLQPCMPPPNHLLHATITLGVGFSSTPTSSAPPPPVPSPKFHPQTPPPVSFLLLGCWGYILLAYPNCVSFCGYIWYATPTWTKPNCALNECLHSLMPIFKTKRLSPPNIILFCRMKIVSPPAINILWKCTTVSLQDIGQFHKTISVSSPHIMPFCKSKAVSMTCFGCFAEVFHYSLTFFKFNASL